MALLALKFEVLGETQFNRAIEGLKYVTDLTKSFEGIAEDFWSTERSQFREEGEFEGNIQWDPLSGAYARWKSWAYPTKTILRLTDRMFKSLTQKGAPDSIFVIEGSVIVGRKTMMIGTSVPYAIYHQLGTDKMPARPPIRLTEAQKKRWVAILRDTLKDSIDTKAIQKVQFS